MSNKTRSLLIQVAAILLAIIFVTLFFNLIELPYSNPKGFVTRSDIERFNPSTNTARLFFFLLVPPLVWWLTRRILLATGSQLSDGAPYFERTPDKHDALLWKAVFICVVCWTVFSSLLFFSNECQPHLVDFFHEGEVLITAFHWAKFKRLWTSAFMSSRGAFYSPLSTVMGWNWFGHDTIGASRMARLVLTAIIPLSFGFFIIGAGWCARKLIGVAEGALLMAALLASFFFADAFFADYSYFALFLEQNFRDLSSSLFCMDRRDTGFMTGAAVLMFAIGYRKRWLWFCSGALFPVASFYTVDRGAFLLSCTGAVLFMRLLLTSDRRAIFKNEVLPWSVGAIIPTLGFASYFGLSETKAFVGFLSYLNQDLLLWTGVRYGAPFEGGNGYNFWRNGLPLYLMQAGILSFALLFPKYKARGRGDLASVHAFFCVASVVYFKSALYNPDLWHVLYGSTFSHLCFAFCLWWAALAAGPRARKFVTVALLPILLFFTANRGYHVMDNLSLITSFPDRAAQLAAQPDAAFLGPVWSKLVEPLREKLKAEQCVFVFQNEPMWAYLLRKPSCTRFYVPATAFRQDHQREMIAELENARPQFIVYATRYPFVFPFNDLNGISNFKYLFLVDEYIKAHYRPAENLQGALQLYERTGQAGQKAIE